VLSQQLLNSIFGNAGAAIKAGKKPQTGGCNPDSDAGSFKCLLNAMGQTLLLFGDIESDDPEALPGEQQSFPTYENPGHHDPSGSPNAYNPNKDVLPADAEEQFANSSKINGVRWTKIGTGKKAVYYRYSKTGNDTWYFSGSTNGVTQNGTPVRIPLDQVPIAVRRS
jgi:hypothetical protein